MSEDGVFTLINVAVTPAWLLLALAPRWSGTRAIVHSGLYPVFFGLTYAAFLINAALFGAHAEGVSYTSLAGVMAIFDHPNGALTGWSHYLVFDLFVGAWIGRDAIRRNVTHIVVLPSLFFCFMFGPIGLLLYFAARMMLGKGSISLSETVEPAAR
ncbi:MAG: DUF4281 domain-containing protein [Parvularculaceae bacterium]|nr:DUF4281 domain-containing protein [Parvularculaceae bacterium]